MATSTWVVVPALEALRLELNAVAPGRDKTSDGGIGNLAHAAAPSGHNPDESGAPEDHDADTINEVRARDFDVDLNRPGLTMERIAQHLITECRAGRITWIKYVIYNRRIWAASSGWVTRVYAGSNAHDHHMHVSCKPDTASENSTRPVGLASLVEDDDVTPEQDARLKRIEAALTVLPSAAATATAVWEYRLDIDVSGTGVNLQPAGGILRYADFRATRSDKRADAVLAKLGSLAAELTAFNAREAAEVPPTAERTARAVVDALAAAAPEQTAAVLKAVLGDRAVQVGRLLAGS